MATKKPTTGFTKAKKDIDAMKETAKELLKDVSTEKLGKESMKKKKNMY